MGMVGLGFMALWLEQSNRKDRGKTCRMPIRYVWEIRSAIRQVVFNFISEGYIG